ncbi:type IV toxin-antitoxin system AbiEi family antitoxin domain-containing protein [Candidatus Poribacteria bacterium]|nr:type IV toxin-antitoxin system AbiEi family antitoxin domain-containing protein [Candidatus Poribacteria bacterium]
MKHLNPMNTNVLQDIIPRCHDRHGKALKQKLTLSAPSLYQGYPYHFTVCCAYKYRVMLHDLETAGISIMPIGKSPGTDHPPRIFAGERFLKRQQAADWDPIRWHKSWGIQVYTGMPSARDGAPWHDITFNYEALCAAPDAILACVQALVDSVTNPLLTITQSGGLRFSCRIPGYLYTKTQQERLYVCNTESLTAEELHQTQAYVEIQGENGYNRWDGRHEILIGDLLDPPIMSEEVFFAPIDALRATLHQPLFQSVPYKENIPAAPYYLESIKLELAKEAFLKHGFSYIKQEDEIQYWSRRDHGIGNVEVALWENEDEVWVRAATSDAEIPTEATRITDVWNDTGILPPLPETGLPIDDRVFAIREGTLSPLALRRQRPVLHKSSPTEKTHETPEKISIQVQQAFDTNVRVLGFIPETTTLGKIPEVASLLQKGQILCLNMTDAEFTAKAEQFLQNLNLESLDATSQTNKAQIMEDFRLVLDPQYAKTVEQLLKTQDGTQWIGIINFRRENQLFAKCELSKTTLNEWVVNWKDEALGKFAIVLLNAVEIRNKTHEYFIRCLRSAIRMFEWLEEELIQQMCHPPLENTQTSSTVCQDPDWTIWHQLKRFFEYYTRDADAPMQWEDDILRFRVPPVLHPNIRRLLLAAPVVNDEHLSRAFMDEKTETLDTQLKTWEPGNRVFQIRTGIYQRETILDLTNTWDSLGVSETGQHMFWRIQAEIERDPNIKHGIITHLSSIEHLKGIAKNENVCFLTSFQVWEGLETAFQEAQVIWVVGLRETGPRTTLERAQILFGNDEEPLSYEMEPKSYQYEDPRVQSVYEKEVFRVCTEIIELAQLNRIANKTIMLITGMRIPEITDRPETLLFDWEDLDIAGELDKLPEAIATREGFEIERDNMTTETPRREVERILGCSTRQANRVLRRMRGGKRARPLFSDQILELLANGEMTTPQIVEAIEGHPKAINSKLTRMVETGEIVKIKRGLYTLPKT